MSGVDIGSGDAVHRVHEKEGLRFDHPESAVEFAYLVESTPVIKMSNLSSWKGGSIKLFQRSDSFSQYDIHATSAFILSTLERTLSIWQQLLLRAKYTIPTIDRLRNRKEDDVGLVADVVIRDGANNIKHAGFARDTIRMWAGLSRVRTDAQWIVEIGCTTRTLRNWRYGRRRRNSKGILRILDDQVGDIWASLNHLTSVPPPLY